METRPPENRYRYLRAPLHSRSARTPQPLYLIPKGVPLSLPAGAGTGTGSTPPSGCSPQKMFQTGLFIEAKMQGVFKGFLTWF